MKLFGDVGRFYEKGVGKVAGIFTGGDARPVAELKYQQEQKSLADALAAKGRGEGESVASKTAMIQNAKNMQNMSSALQSARGSSAGLKQALMAKNSRDMLAQTALGAGALEAQERAQAQGDALNAYASMSSQEFNRERAIQEADEASRSRRAKFAQALVSGGSQAATAGMG